MTTVAPQATDSLQTWLQYLESLHPKSIDLGLDRVRAVAKRLDLNMSAVKFVVGGTNGKGSTCAMLEAILMAAGFRVGLYTSPHLVRFNERARVQGEMIADDVLLSEFVAVESARQDISLTYFEFTTLAILRVFSQQNLDAVILEVGLGGRLDAVNIIDADCAIVTNIDLDHMDWLGDTREKIGLEKAHIYRQGVPAICSDPAAPSTLIEYANQIGADLWLFGRDFNYSGDRQQWAFAGRQQRRHALAYPALRGANQLLNASAALAALESVRDRLPVTQQAIRLGLLQASPPGRFQILPGQPTVILDVAHNPHAAAVLEKNLGNMGFHPYTYAVFGMLADKDIESVVRQLAPRVDHWFCCDLVGPRALPVDLLGKKVRSVLDGMGDPDVRKAGISNHGSPAEAFEKAKSSAKPDDRIVVFGSFLTVSGVLQALERVR